MRAPKTYDELKEAIGRAYPAMSKQLQRIARFALEQPDPLALDTVAAIARAAHVQPSSMIRFANALGYSGFTEMQQVFRGHLVARSASYRERIAEMRRNRSNGGDTAGGVLHQFVTESIDELGHLEEAVSASQFRAAVRLLAGARRIHVIAQRRAFPVAFYLAYALNRLELTAHLLDGVGGMLRELVRGIETKDLLLAVSFRNYSPDVVEVAAACHGRKIPVIAMTDSALSPLKPYARIAFELGHDSRRPFRSLVGPLCLAQALVVSTGHHLTGAEPPRAAARAGH
jgi:DNA-binding MurR/RpiR family transcriptional regulator